LGVSAAEGSVTLSLGCRLNWYRALPVSCVEHLSLTVDGTRLIPDVEYISWAPAGALDSLDQVAAHHRMLRTMWQAAHAGGPGTG
jgi:hypothetical protein